MKVFNIKQLKYLKLLILAYKLRYENVQDRTISQTFDVDAESHDFPIMSERVHDHSKECWLFISQKVKNRTDT